jgi:single-strand DNA-binding protein
MLNKVQLIGNLGGDPEVKRGRDSEFIVFSVATTEKWKDSNGIKTEKTEWHNVTVFAPGLVKVCRDYLRKGSRVYIEGRLQTDRYDKDGQTHYATKVVIPSINGVLKMLDARKDAA